MRPFRTSPRAARRVASVMWLSMPCWSSAPNGDGHQRSSAVIWAPSSGLRRSLRGPGLAEAGVEGQAAVDVEGLAGDVGRVVAGQEAGDAGHLVGGFGPGAGGVGLRLRLFFWGGESRAGG